MQLLLTQHKNFVILPSDKFGSKYIDLIGHSEFGISYEPLIKDNIKHLDYFSLNHWLEQWRSTYENLLKNLRIRKCYFYMLRRFVR